MGPFPIHGLSYSIFQTWYVINIATPPCVGCYDDKLYFTYDGFYLHFLLDGGGGGGVEIPAKSNRIKKNIKKQIILTRTK